MKSQKGAFNSNAGKFEKVNSRGNPFPAQSQVHTWRVHVPMLTEKKALSASLQCESKETNLWHDSCSFIFLIVAQVEYILGLVGFSALVLKKLHDFCSKN